MARMTYIGSCVVTSNGSSKTIPCVSMNSGIENDIQFYDHVVGLRDKDYTRNDSKGPETDEDKGGGYQQIQKKIYRYSPSMFKGKFSGPIAINESIIPVKISIYDIIESAIKGTPINQIDFLYWSSPDPTSVTTKKGHKVKDAIVESLIININSGDIASFDASIVSKKIEDYPIFTPESIKCSKLLTWDKCKVTTYLGTQSLFVGKVQAFSITIKNTVIPIYVSGEDIIPITGEYPYYYAPTDLRLGMQEVTGSVSMYGWNVWETNPDILKFKLGEKEWSLHVLYKPTPSSASGSSEPYVATTPFVGASDTAVWIRP